MKRITAFIGSARKMATYTAVQEFEKGLKRYEDISFEYVFLHEYDLKYCKGCLFCFDKGEEYCPLKDDRDKLISFMNESDGIVLASPNYAFQVSASMKNFLDRCAFYYHRPYFFNKTMTSIVTQGFFGGNNVRKYLDAMGKNFGFKVTKGSCLTTLNPMTKRQQKNLSDHMQKASTEFYKTMTQTTPKTPSFFMLLMFRLTRTNISYIDEDYRDYSYFKSKGWFYSDYYYKVKLNPFKKMLGFLFDLLGRQMARNR